MSRQKNEKKQPKSEGGSFAITFPVRSGVKTTLELEKKSMVLAYKWMYVSKQLKIGFVYSFVSALLGQNPFWMLNRDVYSMKCEL